VLSGTDVVKDMAQDAPTAQLKKDKHTGKHINDESNSSGTAGASIGELNGAKPSVLGAEDAGKKPRRTLKANLSDESNASDTIRASTTESDSLDPIGEEGISASEDGTPGEKTVSSSGSISEKQGDKIVQKAMRLRKQGGRDSLSEALNLLLSVTQDDAREWRTQDDVRITRARDLLKQCLEELEEMMPESLRELMRMHQLCRDTAAPVKKLDLFLWKKERR
jgi:hypothetical protein